MTETTVPAAKLPYLQERFAKLARRAKRLRREPPTLAVVRRHTTRELVGQNVLGEDVHGTRHWVDVAVTGERPKAGPYATLANLVWTPAGNVVRAVPGYEIPTSYRARHECDHCRTRRARKETWLFRHRETDEIVQVGRTCVQDFAGDSEIDPAVMALWADAWGFVGDGEGEWAPEFGIDVVDYLAHVAAHVRVDGWTSRGKATDPMDSTAEQARNGLLAWRHDQGRAQRDGVPSATPDDYQAAEAALAWIQDDADASGDYLHNLRAACSLGYVTDKTLGLVASLVGAAYPRAQRDAAAREAASTGTGSAHVGTIGERGTHKVKVEKIRGWNGNWGWTTMISLRDVAGNLLAWYTTSEIEGLSEGDEIEVKGTIKRHDHDRYTGEARTLLTRCAIIG